MKKRFALFIVVALISLTVCSATIAYNVAQKSNAVMQDNVITEDNTLYKVYNKEPVFENSKLSGENVLTALNKSGKTKKEIYNDIFSYKKFIKTYNISSENLAYLEKLLIQGADVEKIIKIYCFWAGTSENISVVKQIYELSESLYGTYWIEDAFNVVTKNRHGVLDSEGVNAYLAKNITSNDIQIANILSRKGVMTITEILDSFVDEKQWAPIISKVYSVSGNDNLRLNAVNKIATPSDLLKYIFMENSTHGIDEDLTNEKIESFNERINTKVNSELMTKGIFLRDDEVIGKEAADSLKSKIYKNGMTENEVNDLLDKGYKLIDIVNASGENKENLAQVEKVLSQNQNYKISERGVVSE